MNMKPEAIWTEIKANCSARVECGELEIEHYNSEDDLCYYLYFTKAELEKMLKIFDPPKIKALSINLPQILEVVEIDKMKNTVASDTHVIIAIPLDTVKVVEK